ncbi:MAG: PorV/PorQ family protein [Bacteroidota bacterium]
MNKFIKYTALAIVIGVGNLCAQGPVRAGQAGFTQLLINGWGRSSGMGNSYSAGVSGVEAFHLNIAGLGKVQGSELAFSRTSWLGGTGININTFGFGQNLSKGVLGISVMSFSLGQIPITTTAQPDGGIGTYKPSISNINLGYAYNFTSNISAGFNMKVISESTPDVRTGGIAFDAGLQFATELIKDIKKSEVKYVNSSNSPAADRGSDIRFGVSIKNLGPDLKYAGDGLAVKSNVDGKSYTSTTSHRADKTQLPSLINIGLAYDFRLDKGNELYWHRLTTALNFTNNSFSSNQTSLGVEYSYKEILMLRAAFDYEKGIFDYETRRTAYTGLCMGASVQIPLTKKVDNRRENNNAIGVDYSYRSTNPFSGTHTFGVRISID